MAYQMDFFAAPNLERALANIGSKVNYPAYVFIRSDENANTGKLAFVDQNNVLKMIEGENKKQVVNITALPAASEGDIEVLYIMDGTVYVFDGVDYKPQYKDCSAELEELTTRIATLEETVAGLEGSGESIDISGLETKIAAVDEKIDVAVDKSGRLYEKVSYEVAYKPAGTLVDYHNKEIRVMCPADTKWTLQQSGENAEANKYYFGFKAYAPEDAVSFKEDLAEIIADETMYYFEGNEFAGIDDDGRKYSVVWLPAASYDEETGTWAYFGAKSSVDHYVGWNYSVEWYDADGVIIAGDTIRINLSNEECHSSIEPYYVSEMAAKITALKEENATLTDKISALEETVEYIEVNTNTFIELE